MVSYLGLDMYFSYLPCFVAKTESESNSIPPSFALKVVSDFARGLEEASLLCLVRALQFYLQKKRGYLLIVIPYSICAS